VLAAQIVLRYGTIYAVYLDRLEAELEEARQRDPDLSPSAPSLISRVLGFNSDLRLLREASFVI